MILHIKDVFTSIVTWLSFNNKSLVKVYLYLYICIYVYWYPIAYFSGEPWLIQDQMMKVNSSSWN
jgi:hypothetical protein